MKQITFKWIFIAILAFFSTSSLAQDEKPAIPKWHSDKGYWVIEGNINTPLEHTIRFFNNENVLLYRENLSGVKLNPARRAVKMKLKKVLENAAHAWETKKVVEENKSYVAAILR